MEYEYKIAMSDKARKYILEDLFSGRILYVSEEQLGNVLGFLRTREDLKDYKLILTNTNKNIWGIKLSSQIKGEK